LYVRPFSKGKKVIPLHGYSAIKILESEFFNTDDYSLLVFGKIPVIFDKLYLKIFE